MSEYIITDKQAKEIVNQLPTYYVPTWLYLWVHTEYPYEPPNDWIQVREKHIGVNLPEIVRCNSCKYYDECWTSEVYPNRHWCDRLTVYMPPNGFCSFGKRRWLTCKCGEEIETTGGAFVVCPNCGARVIAGD